MQRIYELSPFEASGLEVLHIRFPNAQGAPLAGCEAGTIIYVFTPGEVTVCPVKYGVAKSCTGSFATATDMKRRQISAGSDPPNTAEIPSIPYSEISAFG